MSVDSTGKFGKTYTKSVKGKFRNIRWLVTASILAIYFIIPWIHFGGKRLILFDIPGRKFYLFGKVFWPQDVFYLSIFVIFLVCALFIFTAVAGRLWCGYACPQTIFTDIFISVERLIEGSSLNRKKLDQAPWSGSKILKKTLKHIIWLSISFIVAFSFVAYFIPTAELISRIGNIHAGEVNLIFWLGFFTGCTYLFCAVLKELICLVPCPYGRFQTALFDKDTLIIGYDAKRGEPRGHIKKGDETEKGDCVDCSLCVQVCPTGIDIRKGLQCECIACAMCIDACNLVMKKVGRAQGLIRYSSIGGLSGEKTKILRPRVIFYLACMIILGAFFIFKVSHRLPLEFQVIRDRSALYQISANNDVTNVYTVRITNMDTKKHKYQISTDGIDAKLIMGENPVMVKSGEVYQASALLTAKENKAGKKIKHLNFVVQDVRNSTARIERDITFIRP